MSTVRDLGILIDSRLTMADHFTAICQSAYYQLRQLPAGIRDPTLSPGTFATLLKTYLFV